MFKNKIVRQVEDKIHKLLSYKESWKQKKVTFLPLNQNLPEYENSVDPVLT